MQESSGESHMLFQKNPFRAGIHQLWLSVQPQRQEGQGDEEQRWRKHGMGCLSWALKSISHLRTIPDLLYGVEVSTLPAPGQCSRGEPRKGWGELGESRGYTPSSSCHSLHKQNPQTNAITTSLCRKEGWGP